MGDPHGEGTGREIDRSEANVVDVVPSLAGIPPGPGLHSDRETRIGKLPSSSLGYHCQHGPTQDLAVVGREHSPSLC